MTLIETAQLLDNFGEFFAAIAVVATLGYLAVQIRQNTRSMDESRRLAIAQGYQTRSALGVQAQRLKADSRYIAEILSKTKAEKFTVDSLDPVQRERLFAWHAAYIAEAFQIEFLWAEVSWRAAQHDVYFRLLVEPLCGNWPLAKYSDQMLVSTR